MGDYLSHGLQMMELGRYKEAKEAFLAALEKNPTDPITHLSLAKIALIENDPKLCIDHAIKSLERWSNSSLAFYYMSLANSELDDEEEAMRLMQKALSLSPSNAQFKIGLAQIYLDLKQFGKSQNLLNEVIEDDPENVYAIITKSRIAFLLGQKDEADKWARHALSIDPSNVHVQKFVGDQAINLSDYNLGASVLGQSIHADPNDAIIREKYIDGELARKYKWYSWLILRFRSFNLIPYISPIIFHICLVVLGSVALRVKNEDFIWYGFVKYLAFFLACWNLVFWFVRLICHFWISRKTWNLSIRQFFNFRYLIHLSMSLMLTVFILNIFNPNFLYFATSLVIGLLSLILLGVEVILKDTKYLVFGRAYVLINIALGICTFIAYPYSGEWATMISNVFVFSLFGLPLLGMIISGVFDAVKNLKKNVRTKTTPTKKIKERDVHASLLDKLIDFALIPSIILLALNIGLFRTIRIMDMTPFVLFCTLMIVCVLPAIFVAYKKLRPQSLELVSESQSFNGRAGRIFRMAFTFSIWTIGFCYLILMNSSNTDPSWKSYEIKQHFTPARNHAFIYVIDEKGYTKEVTPPKEIFEKSKESNCIKLLTTKRMFGIRTVEDFQNCE